jgi:hypothetical protein
LSPSTPMPDGPHEGAHLDVVHGGKRAPGTCTAGLPATYQIPAAGVVRTISVPLDLLRTLVACCTPQVLVRNNLTARSGCIPPLTVVR